MSQLDRFADMTKEEKDRLAEQRMEEMRQKNERLAKRYEEIEADKKNADALSSSVAASFVGKKPTVEPEKKPAAPSSVGRGRRLQHAVQERQFAKDLEEKRRQRLGSGDLPPPDPNFRFLADRTRETGDPGPPPPPPPDKQIGSRRNRRNYGGEDFENVKPAMRRQRELEREYPGSPPRSEIERTIRTTGKQRKEYEQWKAESDRIDQERMERGKNSEGQFRREWDRDKLQQEDRPPSPPPPRMRQQRRNFGGEQRSDGPRGWKHDDRGGENPSRGFNRQDSGGDNSSRGYARQDSGGDNSSRGYARQDSGDNSSRGYARQDSGGDNSSRGYVRQDGGDNPSRGYVRQDGGDNPSRGYVRQDGGDNPSRGYNRQDSGGSSQTYNSRVFSRGKEDLKLLSEVHLPPVTEEIWA